MTPSREAFLSIARELLACQTVESVADELERMDGLSYNRGRTSAADSLDELHRKLRASRRLSGRTLGAIAEAARYLREGRLAWLDMNLREDRTKGRSDE